jgi:hypothetical protein
MLMLVAETAG